MDKKQNLSPPPSPPLKNRAFFRYQPPPQPMTAEDENELLKKLQGFQYIPPEEIGKSICRHCLNDLTHAGWCGECEQREFARNWQKLDSGNPEVNSIIADTQFKTKNMFTFLEWISPKKIYRIPGIVGTGGTGYVTAGLWIDGPRKSVQKDDNPRSGPINVALKAFKSPKYFIKELKAIQEWLLNFNEFGREDFERALKYVVRCYGVTFNPATSSYELVYHLVKDGTLREYLDTKWTLLSWQEKLRLTKDLALALQLFHKRNLVHGDFHSANILMNNNVPVIIDLAQCCSEETAKSVQKLPFGLVPYVAPEVWCQAPYTKAADVYSFSVIMFEIATGCRPFGGIAHGLTLKKAVVQGRRPTIAYGSGIPNCYVDLIYQNWSHDPEKRFTVNQILINVCRWYGALLKKNDADIMEDFYKAESRRVKILAEDEQSLLHVLGGHPQATYTSRLLDDSTLRKQV
ncbi:1297_t:CDS:2 [Ambispora leptoticha]|uniref:1297_t:CDS:1 n=1 Tax=Ambispora leptoticha TaxID=144679 RepID=A0A9N9H773_9GLOM|nr:1297_t:CDS:2 [Ambispora leptoticha]